MLILVTTEELDVEAAVRDVADPGAGAINVFHGVVRNTNKGRGVGHLVYEAYAEMAEKVMGAIAIEARERFGLKDCAVMHRTGRLEIGETSLLIAVSSAHRVASFEGCHWLVDEVKKRVPVWKKEIWDDGEEWIEGPEALGMLQAPVGVR
jgi:molybdopterin synthase catalytic subunit